MLEIEIKAYCDDHSKVVSKILSMGGRLKQKINEKDFYFNHPCRDFACTDEALRIRVADQKNILTYKGPKIGKKTKTRVEEEVEFEDFNSMKEILVMLGFIEVGAVVKERKIYILRGFDICIDRVEEVGDFVELEKKSMDRESVEKELFELAEELGLSRFERRSYLELKLDI